MASQELGADVTLRLERTIAAPPARIYAAWTQAEELTRWFAPSNEFKTVVTALDTRVGGRYRIEMHRPDGKISIAIGQFRELNPPNRLAFTWRWEENPDMPDSVVTVTISPEGKGSRLVLVHEKLADAKSREGHNQGWIGCLGRLEVLFQFA